MTIDFLYILRVIYLLGAFLLGGIPFGLIIAKLAKGMDIRKQGSGNVGATNVTRILGIGYGVLTFLLDGLKVFIPTVMAKINYGIDFSFCVMAAGVFGHIFSPWLGFRGGKGFASFISGLLAIDPRMALLAGLIWLIVFVLTRISALAALLSTAVVTGASYFFFSFFQYILMLVMAAIIFWAHRKNISDIWSKFRKEK